MVAVAELTRLVLPALRAARGRVVLVNSGAGRNASPGWASYAASKFALRAFADALRAEEEGNGVRVTSVYPGRTDTEMQRDVVRQEGGVYRPERYLRAESVAGAVLLAVTAPDDAALTELVLRPAAPDGESPLPRRRVSVSTTASWPFRRWCPRRGGRGCAWPCRSSAGSGTTRPSASKVHRCSSSSANRPPSGSSKAARTSATTCRPVPMTSSTAEVVARVQPPDRR